jgi:hypothetical protein
VVIVEPDVVRVEYSLEELSYSAIIEIEEIAA